MESSFLRSCSNNNDNNNKSASPSSNNNRSIFTNVKITNNTSINIPSFITDINGRNAGYGGNIYNSLINK